MSCPFHNAKEALTRTIPSDSNNFVEELKKKDDNVELVGSFSVDIGDQDQVGECAKHNQTLAFNMHTVTTCVLQ